MAGQQQIVAPSTKPVLGWREWIALPELGINPIKAKIDTGARTSALHAFMIDPYKKAKQPWVMFAIHPIQKQTDVVVECHAAVKDRRIVSDSGGHKQRRYVLETNLVIGAQTVKAEITLTNRDSMVFRMLIGRTALRNDYFIDAHASFVQGYPRHFSPTLDHPDFTATTAKA